MTDAAEPPADLPDAPTRFVREQLEFGRAINYFDATFAIATTLLVTTLAAGTDEWASWSALASAIDGPILAYALSFVVVTTFWWSNHRFVTSLEALSSRLILWSMVMLGFVVLLPFSTEGLGTYSSGGGQVPTVFYAVNVAAVSLCTFLLYRIALADDLYAVRPSPPEIVERSVTLLDTPLVFLLSVPIALFWSPDWARYSWLLLVAFGTAERRWIDKRRRLRASTRPPRPDTGLRPAGDRPDAGPLSRGARARWRWPGRRPRTW